MQFKPKTMMYFALGLVSIIIGCSFLLCDPQQKYDPIEDILEMHHRQIQDIYDELEFVKARVRILEKENI